MVGSGPNQAESMGSQHEDHFVNLERRKGQKVSSIIQSDVLGNSVDKDMHCERMGQNGS